MQDVIDQVALMRMIARDELGQGVHAAFGYIQNYYTATGTADIALPSYQNPLTAKPLIAQNVAVGSPFVGSGYGLEIYPEVGTPCLLVVVNKDSNITVSATLLWNQANQPVGGLNPGELRITSKSGSRVYFDGNGNVKINNGSTPVAVEGSKVTHIHGLSVFFAALAAEIAAYIAANPPSAASMGATDLAAIFAALAMTMAGPPVTGTDIAGTNGPTPSAVDSGQGAQDVLAPTPGGH
jgi:hypothetical protein